MLTPGGWLKLEWAPAFAGVTRNGGVALPRASSSSERAKRVTDGDPASDVRDRVQHVILPEQISGVFDTYCAGSPNAVAVLARSRMTSLWR
ncbi:MAG: hypothetical protein C0519_05160 [Hyphomicrobium sp.]|nr:hypothetical protein [Hyphomicrobium sp.]PPD08593.1 MAG: hypothetical protein CTY28_04200 [Hyphomicrobium sp.]